MIYFHLFGALFTRSSVRWVPFTCVFNIFNGGRDRFQGLRTRHCINTSGIIFRIRYVFFSRGSKESIGNCCRDQEEVSMFRGNYRSSTRQFIRSQARGPISGRIIQYRNKESRLNTSFIRYRFLYRFRRFLINLTIQKRFAFQIGRVCLYFVSFFK